MEDAFKPSRTAVFLHFKQQYRDLSLANCTGVLDFVTKLRRARAELLNLGEDCKIGDPHFYDFLFGLGSDYYNFVSNFTTMYDLTKAVTFDLAVMLAEREEIRLKMPETESKALPMPTVMETPVKMEFCTQYEHHLPTQEDCFKLAHQIQTDKMEKGKKSGPQKMSKKTNLSGARQRKLKRWKKDTIGLHTVQG